MNDEKTISFPDGGMVASDPSPSPNRRNPPVSASVPTLKVGCALCATGNLGSTAAGTPILVARCAHMVAAGTGIPTPNDPPPAAPTLPPPCEGIANLVAPRPTKGEFFTASPSFGAPRIHCGHLALYEAEKRKRIELERSLGLARDAAHYDHTEACQCQFCENRALRGAHARWRAAFGARAEQTRAVSARFEMMTEERDDLDPAQRENLKTSAWIARCEAAIWEEARALLAAPEA